MVNGMSGIPTSGDFPQTSSQQARLVGIDKILVILCHLSIFLGLPFLFPIVLYLAKKNEDWIVKEHARECLNFHLSLMIYALVCFPLMLVVIGFALLGLVGLFGAICAIIAALKASDDICYRYPLSIRFVK